jgi:Fe-S-cluster containining protein
VDAPHRQTPKSKTTSTTRGDSIDKIVTSYFATLTAEPFQYKGKEYLPRDVFVRPGIVRGYTCPPMCGGCCPRFSLDYIEPDGVPIVGEQHPLTPRMVEFNGRHVEVWSDKQDDHKNPKCRNLNWDNGRCGIHGNQPFSCDFELLRSFTSEKGNRSDFSQQLYGRGSQMKRIDGKPGALCKMLPTNPERVADVDRRLARLEVWMTHFGLSPKRVAYIRSNLDWIAETGKALTITEREQLTCLEGDA